MPRKRKESRDETLARLETVLAAPNSPSVGFEVLQAAPGEATAAAPVSDPPSLEPAPNDEAEIKPDTGMVTTVTVPLDASGQVAWSSLKKESTKAKIRKLLQVGEASDEKHQELVGLAKMAPAIWMGIASACTWALSSRLPGPLQEQVAETMSYSKEELKALAEPTAGMIQKYVPGGLAKWSLEINFGMAVLSVHAGKLMAIRELTAAYAKAEAEKPPPIAQPESIANNLPPLPPEPSLGVPE